MIRTFSNYKFLLNTLAYYASKKSLYDNTMYEKKDEEGDDIFNYYYESEEEVYLDSPIYVN